MKQLYKIYLILTLFFGFFIQASTAQVSFGIKEGVGNELIVYMTTTSPLNPYPFDDFIVTLKWPVNTVIISGFSNTSFPLGTDIVPQAPEIDNSFNYMICKTVKLGDITLAADGTELSIFTIEYTHIPGGACAGEFEIVASDIWTQGNSGDLELIDGFNGTASWSPGVSNVAAGNLNPVKILDVAKTDVKCKGESTGSIALITDPDVGLTYTVGGTSQTTNIFSNLNIGNYSISATDGTCTANYTAISISEPSSSIAIGSQIATDITCNNVNDGTITISATGGTGSLQYAIDGGTNYQGLGTYLNLPSSTYNIAVRDANNCVVNGSARTINNPTLVTIQSQSKTDITCAGRNDGKITLNVVGGTGTYSYSNDNGVSYFNNGGNFVSLLPNTYTLMVKDINNCAVSGGNVLIIEPAELVISNIATTPVTSCNSIDGSITVSATGGTGTLEFSRTGGLYQPANTFSALSAGEYHVYVRDLNLCLVDQIVTLSELNPIVLDSIVTTALTCHDDSDGGINIYARGGAAPLEYSILPNIFSSTSIFSNLVGATYQVYIKDANGCSIYKSETVINPQSIVLEIAAVENITTCFGEQTGMLRFSAIGGTGVLSYTINATDFQLSSQFSDIAGGFYTALVQDENMCEATVQAVVDQPEELLLNLSLTDINCNGLANGSIKIAPEGGVPNYNINWSASDGDSDDYNLLGLGAGIYTVTLSDAHSCLVFDTVEVTMPPPLVITSDVVDLTCYGAQDGTVSAHISGGEAPYRYRWNNNQVSSDLVELSAGEYRLTVTDFRKCNITYSVEVFQPEPLKISYELTNTSFLGSDDGTITMNVIGGTLPYFFSCFNEFGVSMYSQEDGVGVYSVLDLGQGIYSVNIEDLNYCSYTVNDLDILTQQTDVEVPSAFTPNGDGKNDVWTIKSIIKYPNATLKIFDSRGYLVYSNDEEVQSWDGTDNSGNPLPGSTLYYYVIEVDKNTAPYKGTVYIIR